MRHHRFEAIICDYGNVLTRTLDPEPRAIWERRLGLAAGTLEALVHNDHSWLAAQRGQMTPEAHWHAVGTHLGLDPGATAALRTVFYQGDVLNTPLVARLEQLRSVGIRLAILSNFSRELHALLRQHDLRRRFDHIVISAEIGVMKPAAEAYMTVLHRLALPAQQCVFIDDLPANVAAARLLGMHGIVFDDTPSCLAALERLRHA